jgi:uncharacterized membrane-anchored protein YhcB (DUF1043 family)
MRWVPIMLVVAILGVGCAPTVERQRSARLEALQLELEGTLATWKTQAQLGHFGTSANAARALAARYDGVYERWGLRADPLTQAMLAYALALAIRVDRKELSADEANTLLEKMRTDLGRRRSALPGGRAESAADRDAALLACWKDFWAANQKAFEVTPRNPVRCEIASPSGDGSVVACY